MRKPSSLAAAAIALALSGAANTVPQKDVFVIQAALAPADTDGRLLIDATFGKRGALEQLRSRMAKGPMQGHATEAWTLLCSQDFLSGRYRDAVPECEKSDAGQPAKDDSALPLVRALADVPAPAAHGKGARVPINDKHRIMVRLGDYAVPAVADTGAEVSVAMASVAEALKVRFLAASIGVGTVTSTVSGRIGVIPQLSIGEARVTDIPVLVLPDEQLTFAEGRFKLQFILGLHAFRPFGRMAWLDHGKVLALGDHAPVARGQGVPVFWDVMGVGIPLDGPGGRRAAHFDTGSGSTNLFEPGLALVAPKERAAIVTAEQRVGGVGGIVTQKIQRLPIASLSLAGQPFVLKNVDVERDISTGDAARVGDDIFARFRTVILDFDRMQFAIEP